MKLPEQEAEESALIAAEAAKIKGGPHGRECTSSLRAGLSNYTSFDIKYHMKRPEFLGDTLEQLKEFPETARQEAGVQFYKAQQGLNLAAGSR